MARSDLQRAEDAATILPFAAAALLVPPAILIFAVPASLAGIPLIMIYIFGLWAAVIGAAFLLARRLAESETAAADEEPPQAGG